jgi:6-phosphofructokinase 1
MSIGILTAGGVCPGINTIIRNIAINEIQSSNTVYGFMDGYYGLNKNIRKQLNTKDVNHLHRQPGSILQTSRERLHMESAIRSLYDMDRLYCIGGNGTLEAAKILSERSNTNIIGIAKTIDNDIHDIESFGHNTAIEETSRFIDCAHVEAKSMSATVIVETMGRNSGYIAKQSSIVCDDIVDLCIVKEQNMSCEDYIDIIKRTYIKKSYAVIVMSEGYEEKSKLMKHLKKLLIFPKSIVPGYAVRSVKPNPYDIRLCYKMSQNAYTLASSGEKNFIQGSDRIIPFKDFKTGEKLVCI